MHSCDTNYIYVVAGDMITLCDIAGSLLVMSGVDALSRATEFALSRYIFKQLQEHCDFGRAGTRDGFTIDLCASNSAIATKQR